MVDKKSTQKPRHVRHTTARATRRSLSTITPSNSAPQSASPLFSVLPSEIRNLIFEYAICQTRDPSRRRPTKSNIYRPGHTHRTHLSTELLRTCRLIYYETHAIPLQSATHHIYHFLRYGDENDINTSENVDHYLYHMSSQQGAYLYHLHYTMSHVGVSQFLKYTRHAHLQWKKITWTVRVSFWSAPFIDPKSISIDLLSVALPSTCQEVNLELEALEEDLQERRSLERHAKDLRMVRVRRKDRESLKFDESSRDFTWQKENVTYYVIRLCWRSEVPRREYMHLDHLDCLTSSLAKVVEKNIS